MHPGIERVEKCVSVAVSKLQRRPVLKSTAIIAVAKTCEANTEADDPLRLKDPRLPNCCRQHQCVERTARRRSVLHIPHQGTPDALTRGNEATVRLGAPCYRGTDLSDLRYERIAGQLC